MDTSGELLLFASPEIGHLLAEVELGKRLIALDSRLSVAILVPQYPSPNPTVDASIRSLQSSLLLDRIDLLLLPPLQNLPPNWSSLNHIAIVDLLARLYQPTVKQISNSRPIRTAGIVFDMFGAPMIEVADDLKIPSYLFFTSGANMLRFQFAMEALNSPDLGLQFAADSPESTPVNIQGFKNRVPKKVWPTVLLHKDWSPIMISFVREYKKAKGILVNTFAELESDLLQSLAEFGDGGTVIPPVYSVGPILHLGRNESGSNRDPALSWLDEQPKGSVVFLCFGSKIGSFEKAQVEQLAAGLERSGHRFLWSLRAASLEEILPEGFMERTSGVGKVIGWAPQTDILAHEAVGAFVSHCGWNSTLESLWFGVPLVTWPMYAEQQLNAFYMATELGLAVDLRMDYNFDMEEGKGNVVVEAAEVEAAIRRAMEEEEGAVARKKVKEVSEVARRAVEVGGSSTVSLSRFVEGVFKNLGA